MKTYVVRIVQTCDAHGIEQYEGGRIDDFFLEVLRFMGVVVIHDTDPKSMTMRCFDLEPSPACLEANRQDSKDWSERVATQMRLRGFNAVSAPSIY